MKDLVKAFEQYALLCATCVWPKDYKFIDPNLSRQSSSLCSIGPLCMNAFWCFKNFKNFSKKMR